MLRAIGHVLHNVDSEKSPRHRKVIESMWAEWKANKDEHWISFDFIEKEGNNVLKPFSFGGRNASSV